MYGKRMFTLLVLGLGVRYDVFDCREERCLIMCCPVFHEILDLFESVSEGFPTFFWIK